MNMISSQAGGILRKDALVRTMLASAAGCPDGSAARQRSVRGQFCSIPHATLFGMPVRMLCAWKLRLTGHHCAVKEQ